MTGLDDDTPMTLDEAAEALLRGVVTASTLRAAIGRKDLACKRIGRRIMVTPADIRAWRERCRVPAVERASTGAPSMRPRSARSDSAAVAASLAACRAALDNLGKMKPARKGRHR